MIKINAILTFIQGCRHNPRYITAIPGRLAFRRAAPATINPKSFAFKAEFSPTQSQKREAKHLAALSNSVKPDIGVSCFL